MTESNNRMVKHSGQVFTPDFLVEAMLNYTFYVHGRILRKHVIDNSCGDGAFLCEVVYRYCSDYINTYNSTDGLKKELETFIHGIELDEIAYENCRYNLSSVAEKFGVEGDICWDIIHDNALKVTKFNGIMDFVVGNPPYVRVHNLENDYETVKTFKFTQNGMTDLYLVFFELSFKMLNKKGKLCYITPSSWLSSLAAITMRSYIMQNRTLAELIDLGHYQAFDNVTTYTMIAIFDMCHEKDNIDYYRYSPEFKDRVHVDTLSYEEICIGSNFYVASHEKLLVMRAVKTAEVPRYVKVKNGFATLADKIFITNVPFTSLTIPIVKASTGKWYHGFFPYNDKGMALSRNVVFSFPEISSYLNENKSILLKGKSEEEKPDWYLYGRTQAIRDVFVKKYSINTIISTVASIKLTEVPSGSGLYSGLYIITNVPIRTLEKIIKCEDFIDYLKTLKNYKSGGYYTYNSKDLEQYLNYKLSDYEEAKHIIPVEKRRLLEGHLEFI